MAGLLGSEPSQQIGEDLHRLKQILEVGEIATTEGQPSGRQEKPHPRERADREVHNASMSSFPASDAPAFTR